jgi:hypothetical protein
VHVDEKDTLSRQADQCVLLYKQECKPSRILSAPLVTSRDNRVESRQIAGRVVQADKRFHLKIGVVLLFEMI